MIRPMRDKGCVRLLYDGTCSFCERETARLCRWGPEGRLLAEDIQDPSFDPGRYGLTRSEITSGLHAVLPGGQIVSRMDAVRAAYKAIGLGWLVAPTRWPVVRRLFDGAYSLFARHRIHGGPSCSRVAR